MGAPRGERPVGLDVCLGEGGPRNEAPAPRTRMASDPLEAFVHLLLHERSCRLARARGLPDQGGARLWLPAEGAPARLLEALREHLPGVEVRAGTVASHADEQPALPRGPVRGAMLQAPGRAELTPAELAMLLDPLEGP